MAASASASSSEAEDKIPRDQLRKACVALLRHLKKKSEDSGSKKLLGEEADPETIVVNFVLHKLPAKVQHKPVQIKLPNTLLDPERGVSLCLFVKDPASELEEVLASAPVPGFDRVIGYKKLREEFREFKRRRALLSEHDAFFCDDRILPMLPKLVGKTFLRPRQTPVPVRLGRVPVGDKAAASKGAAGRALAAALGPARDSTWIRMLGQGSTFSVRTGFPYFTPDQLADNAAAVVRRAAEAVPGGWRNVQAVFIKSTNSVPLQVYASLASLGAGDTATEVAGAALKAVAQRKRARSPAAGDAAGKADEEEAVSPKRVARTRAAAPKGKEAVRAVRAVLGDDITAKKARGGRRKSRRK